MSAFHLKIKPGITQCENYMRYSLYLNMKLMNLALIWVERRLKNIDKYKKVISESLNLPKESDLKKNKAEIVGIKT